jgi:hypothetical protein
VIASRLALVLFACVTVLPAIGSAADQPAPRPAPAASVTPAASAPPATPAPSPAPTTAPRRGRRGAAAPQPSPSPGAVSFAAMSAMMAGPQPYALFTRRTERQSGLIDIIKKDDDYYLDLGPAQFDHPYIVAPVLASGLGEEAFAGRIFDSFIIRFKRVGRRVLWIQDNTSFSAPPDTPAANALAISVTDSVLNATPIVSEDEAKQHVVVSAAFFLTDFENVARTLGEPSQPLILSFGPARPTFAVDPTKSYIEKTKALPANDEILSSLAFMGPPGDLTSAPDGRGVRLRMHYSIVDAPAMGAYVPRLADDRVGYFITAQKRFDDDAQPTPFVRYIDRWNFANGPIVYYLTNEIPARYKPAIRSALLEWNGAFAKIGIPNAIEVKDQPSDPNWDPDDARYSTVRWITSDHPAFAAYGPHIADPRTGQILRVEIVIDGEALRSVKRGYVDQIEPTHPLTRDAAGLPVPGALARVVCTDSSVCDRYEEDSAELAADGTIAMMAAGATPAQTQTYAEDWLHSVVLHESGHNFGLRHNFAASTLYSMAQLHDKHFTSEHGLVGSVMEYTPVNLSPSGRPQGDYFQQKLGPYDEWAIRYGYERFPNVRRAEDEILPLRGIANESTRPEYIYETDEDANGLLAIDPRVATYDLSSDPLAYDRNQFDVYDGLIAKLDRTFPRVDEPYYQERQSFETILRGYRRAALLATKYVGGIHTSRAHRGQPGGAPPFSPVARAQSRRAFDLLSDNVFSSRAMHFSPRLLSDLGADRYLHRGVDDVERPDFPVEEEVGDMQDAIMFQMFSPDTMSRLADERYKLAPGQTTMTLDDLFGWTQAAVWDDLDRPAIDPLHRALQRRYTNLLVAFSLAPSALVADIGYPSDAAPLARYELRRLHGRIVAALRNPHLEIATRAHLEDTESRVKHALDPNAVRGA